MDTAELHRKLDPDLDYFDATPSIEVIAEQMAALQGFIEMQLGINQKLLENVAILRQQVVELEQSKTKLILPERMN